MELHKKFKELVTRGLEKYGLYYSVYRGIVVSNKDPQNLHRVKLQVPQVAGDYTIDYWAWPIGIPSTPNMGFQLIPKVGEMVWVQFEFGNPRRPIWRYGYRGTEDYIEDDLKNLNTIWFKTKAGHKVILDDDNKLVKLVSAGGLSIEIGDTISLGKLEGSTYKAVLGDNLKDLITDLVDIYKSATVATQNGPQTIDPTSITKLEELVANINNILSSKITLE